ncbi:MAG: hypothetical protein QOE80_3299 [Actinomycetota bacterium]|jgi:hypothetical protein|nr:hypothetical protein [Actinomycetota bacterium]
MARRNLLRSLATASLLALTGVGGAVFALPAAPAGAESVPIVVTVRDDGFSQTDIQARVGDHLIFQLDSVATRPHTLAWETGQLQYHFDRARGNNTAQYGPLRAGRLRFFDSDTVAGPDAGPPFAGTLVVSDAPPQPPDTTSSSTSTTVTTAVRPTTTTVTTARPEPTTTVYPPTTQTTGFTTIHPMLVADPAPPTTTTTAPKKKDSPVDKQGKAKAAGTETATTAAPAPPGPPSVEPVFDPETLTPAPLPSPAGDITAVIGPGQDANLDASAAASLLKPDKAANDTGLLLAALGALVLFLVLAMVWRWHHRSSRYFPA